MRKSSIVVLDIDGTLTDSVTAHQAAFEAALRTFAFPALRTDWGSYQHHSDSAIFAEAWGEAGLAGGPDLAQLEREFATAFERHAPAGSLREVAGASAFLAAVEASPWVACFATGSLKAGATRKLAVLSPAIDDDLVVTASEFTTREEIVAAAIARAKLKHGLGGDVRIVSVGDGLWDLFTARNLGLEFLGIGRGEKGERLRAHGATVFEDFGSRLELEGLG